MEFQPVIEHMIAHRTAQKPRLYLQPLAAYWRKRNGRVREMPLFFHFKRRWRRQEKMRKIRNTRGTVPWPSSFEMRRVRAPSDQPLQRYSKSKVASSARDEAIHCYDYCHLDYHSDRSLLLRLFVMPSTLHHYTELPTNSNDTAQRLWIINSEITILLLSLLLPLHCNI